MNCAQVEAELVTYHFGEVDEALRADIEHHLLGCRACLSAFLAIKREIETVPTTEAPSARARARLRGAVAETLGFSAPTPRRWSWWERPLAFGCAAAVILAVSLFLRLLATSPGTPPHSLGQDKASQPMSSSDH